MGEGPLGERPKRVLAQAGAARGMRRAVGVWRPALDSALNRCVSLGNLHSLSEPHFSEPPPVLPELL